jgi:NADH:ubiquinone oxidoreductase subunit K
MKILFKIAQWKLLWKEDWGILIPTVSLIAPLVGFVLGLIGIATKNDICLFLSIGLMSIGVLIVLLTFFIDWVTNRIVEYVAWKE